MEKNVLPSFTYDPTGFEIGIARAKGIEPQLFDTVTFSVVSTPQSADEAAPEPVEVAFIHFQNGPIQKYGMNGVQVPDLIGICVARLELVSRFGKAGVPDHETQQAINKLMEANMWLDARTQRRIAEGTEGRQAFTQKDG